MLSLILKINIHFGLHDRFIIYELASKQSHETDVKRGSLRYRKTTTNKQKQ